MTFESNLKYQLSQNNAPELSEHLTGQLVYFNVEGALFPFPREAI